jgi:hypothetical protein
VGATLPVGSNPTASAIFRRIPHYRSDCICRWIPTVTYESLKIIEVMKCPSCGYSDDGSVNKSSDYQSYHPTDNSQMVDSVVDFLNKMPV